MILDWRNGEEKHSPMLEGNACMHSTWDNEGCALHFLPEVYLDIKIEFWKFEIHTTVSIWILISYSYFSWIVLLNYIILRAYVVYNIFKDY